MGWQGYVIIAIIIMSTAIFAASRTDWASLLLSALVPPLILFPLIFVLSRPGGERDGAHNRMHDSGRGVDFLTFLARTNPIMFLLVGAVSRRQDDEQYQQLLSAGPYALGRRGYLVLVLLILLPLIGALIITVVSGQLPTHSGPQFP